MAVVVDACLAIKWGVQEEYTEQALELWDVWQDSNELLAAPPLFRAEVTSVLHRMVRRSSMDPLDASDILEALLTTVAHGGAGGAFTSGRLPSPRHWTRALPTTRSTWRWPSRSPVRCGRPIGPSFVRPAPGFRRCAGLESAPRPAIGHGLESLDVVPVTVRA